MFSEKKNYTLPLLEKMLDEVKNISFLVLSAYVDMADKPVSFHVYTPFVNLKIAGRKNF